MIVKEFSRIVCVSLFSYQCSLFFTVSRQLIYFTTSSFVCQELFWSFSNFFSKMKFCHPCWRLDYFIIDKSDCQQVFYFIFYFKVDSKVKNNGEGGIWTLAPRKRPIPLAGAPLRPLEYFSGLRNHNLLFIQLECCFFQSALVIILKNLYIVNGFF